MEEIDKPKAKAKAKAKEEPTHLSGAYIRSLVKQLTSSSRSTGTTKHQPLLKDTTSCLQNMMSKFDEENQHQHQQQPPQPQPHKKQVRRRLHTTRPYQERLLNMAEARREIVTALKLHRAAMKQANEQHQQEQPPPVPPSSVPVQPFFDLQGRVKSRRNYNLRLYPSSTAELSSYVDNFSYTSLSHPPPPSYPFSSWSSPPPILQSPCVLENLNFPLPNQTLGLNLNFHDFNNIDSSHLYHNSGNTPSSVYSSSSSSIVTEEVAKSPERMMMTTATMHPSAVFDVTAESCSGGGGLHQVMDDEEMAEIRSLGEQHQMEWNDTMNLVTSAWWFKVMKTMEVEPPGEVKAEEEDQDQLYPFGQVMEVPAWLNTNDGSLQEQHIIDYNASQHYFHDPSLPCMDIGEIDGIDGEWLT